MTIVLLLVFFFFFLEKIKIFCTKLNANSRQQRRSTALIMLDNVLYSSHTVPRPTSFEPLTGMMIPQSGAFETVLPPVVVSRTSCRSEIWQWGNDDGNLPFSHPNVGLAGPLRSRLGPAQKPGIVQATWSNSQVYHQLTPSTRTLTNKHLYYEAF